jgi:RNA polymerase sigma-70 factor (ECF subfamily)
LLKADLCTIILKAVNTFLAAGVKELKRIKEMDDNLLVKGCLQGKREEFHHIVERYGGKMLALAMNLLQNREDAEDACQEAFIKAYRSLRSFDSRKSFKNWLYAIVYNRCLDQLRKRHRFLDFFKRAKREHPPPAFAQIPHLSLAQPLMIDILKKLSPKERISLFLWANEGFTGEEVSSVLKCSPSTARVYLFKARKKVKALLEKEND